MAAVAAADPASVAAAFAAHPVISSAAGAYLLHHPVHGKARKKLHNALEKYGSQGSVTLHAEDVVFMFDETVFGSGRDGFLVTNRYLAFHNLMGSTHMVPLASVTSVTTGSNELTVRRATGGAVSVTITGVSSRALNAMAASITAIAEAARGGKSAVPPSVPPTPGPITGVPVDHATAMVTALCARVALSDSHVIVGQEDRSRTLRENAVKKYAGGQATAAHIVLLYDNTVSRTGRDGFSVWWPSTGGGAPMLGYNNMFSSSNVVPLDAIVRAEPKSSAIVFHCATGRKHEVYMNVSDGSTRALSRLLSTVMNELLGMLRSRGEDAAVAATSPPGARAGAGGPAPPPAATAPTAPPVAGAAVAYCAEWQRHFSSATCSADLVQVFEQLRGGVAAGAAPPDKSELIEASKAFRAANPEVWTRGVAAMFGKLLTCMEGR